MFERKGLILLSLIIMGSLASGLMLVLSREAATLKVMKAAVETCNERDILIEYIEIRRVRLEINRGTKSLGWRIDIGGSLVSRDGEGVGYEFGSALFVDLFTGEIISGLI